METCRSNAVRRWALTLHYWYTQDEYMEVSDDVAEVLRASVRYEAAYTERARYNKAYYSLDADDGIEYSACEDIF